MKIFSLIFAIVNWMSLVSAEPSSCNSLFSKVHFAKIKTDEGRLFVTKSFELNPSAVDQLSKYLARHTPTVNENSFTEFFFQGFLGLEMDSQGSAHGGVLLSKVLPPEFYMQLTDMVKEAIFSAKQKIKGFKPKVALIRYYHREGGAGMWHYDHGTTYIQSLMGPSTIFRPSTFDDSSGYLFDKHVEHSFPRSPVGRTVLLIAE